jgi:ribonuclease Z
MYNYALAASFVACSLVVSASPAFGAIARGRTLDRARQVASRAAAPDELMIVLLGTGAGPGVNLQQFGASTLVEVGGKRLLFDCGRGATMRLVQAGVDISSVTRLFLTHLHSDHIVQIPDLLLAGWVGMPGREEPLKVWGPDGTTAMMAALQIAFAFDIHMRRDVDEHLSVSGITVESYDIKQGVVFDEDGVTVTAFLVDHGPVTPAFGYRIDYRGRSVALSGDTRVSENLVKFAKGVDVLIHEAVDPVAARARSQNLVLTERVIAHHTTAEQAGEVFASVKPRLAVYSHAPNSEEMIAQTRRTYSGPLQSAEDLLAIDVGEQIRVRHLAR